MHLDRYNMYATPILRMGLGFVFMWFGYSCVTDPGAWVDLVPRWTSIIGSAEVLVRTHGVVELIAGLLLFAGIQTRLMAALLFVVLMHTIVLLDFGPIMVRDIGLATALLSLAVQTTKLNEAKAK